MGNELNYVDHYSSNNYGVYLTNSFFSKFKIDVDISNVEKKGALPTYVHEYIHYIQNISTTAGLTINLLVHSIMAAVVNGYNFSNGVINGPKEDSNWNEFINDSFGTVNFIKGTSSIKSKRKFNIVSVDRIAHKSMLGQVNILRVKFCREVGGQIHEDFLDVGSDVINEGVAYEIEKSVWSADLISCVEQVTPYYPYKFYGDLIEYIAGDKLESEDKIRLGVAALMSESPGDALHAGAKCYTNKVEYNKYLENQDQIFREFSQNKLVELIEFLKEFYINSEFLNNSYDYYINIISEACNKRTKKSFLEKDFINLKGREEFFNLVSRSSAHLFIQEKEDGKSDISIVGVFDWEESIDKKNIYQESYKYKNNIEISKADDKSVLFVLCLAVHFIAQHFNKKSFIGNTEDLNNKACPFSGGCPVQKSRGDLDACKTKPWTLNNVGWDLSKGTCWYQAAVKALTPA